MSYFIIIEEAMWSQNLMVSGTDLPSGARTGWLQVQNYHLKPDLDGFRYRTTIWSKNWIVSGKELPSGVKTAWFKVQIYHLKPDDLDGLRYRSTI